jgi:hypothetical protein
MISEANLKRIRARLIDDLAFISMMGNSLPEIAEVIGVTEDVLKSFWDKWYDNFVESMIRQRNADFDEGSPDYQARIKKREIFQTKRRLTKLTETLDNCKQECKRLASEIMSETEYLDKLMGKKS